ncbi:MAG: PAS domain S-box protein [Deltaproteobacteria bacterium]|nr:PAS domain S-box protein [Deltaproteobacteria bacterium]
MHDHDKPKRHRSQELRVRPSDSEGAENSLKNQLCQARDELERKTKELDCLYRISRLLEQPGLPLEAILDGVVNIIPSTTYSPESAWARITLEDQVFTSGTFRQTRVKEAAPITVHDKQTGSLELFFPEGESASNTGSFQEDRERLLRAIAERLGRVVERKRAQRALQENEKKYRSLFDESRDAIYITSPSDRFLDANQAALDLFGYTREKLGKRSIREFYVDRADRDIFRHELERNGSVRNYEVALRKQDETTMDCLLTATTWRSEDGSVLGYQTIIRDITEYKRTVEALQKSEARYRAIVEDQTELICRFRPDGTLTFANEALCRYVGGHEKTSAGKSYLLFIAQEDRAKVAEHLSSLSPENQVTTHECRGIASNGEIRWQQWTNRLIIDKKGAALEIQSVGRDITERKEIEAALEKNSEKIKRFAYSVSHDLKNPVIGLHGLSKLLHKHYRENFDERGKKFCDQILKTSEQVAELVDRINMYIAMKETPLVIERLNLKDIFRTIREDFSSTLTDRTIQWSEPNTPPQIEADHVSLLRILRNLVDNALKYGGEKLSRITIGYEESDDFHLFSVTDDGVGIKKEAFEEIFGFFQRNETSRGVEGTGLGLAIVRDLVEQHGGKAWLESPLEKGTTFYFSILKKLKSHKSIED